MYFLRNTSYNKWRSSTPTFLLVVRLDAFKKPPQHALNAVGLVYSKIYQPSL